MSRNQVCKHTLITIIMLTVLGRAIVISTMGIVCAQPSEEWSKTFGGKESDLGYSVQQTTDGGYIIAGVTESFGLGSSGSSDVYLVKTDPEGDLVWSKAFGGTDEDGGYSVKQTSDGGYIISGYTYVFGAGLDVYLVKTHSDGSEQWSKTFGGSEFEHGFSVQQTSDGGYIIAGITLSFGAIEPKGYLVKTDPEGNMLWNKTFGRSLMRSVQQTTDGGYIIAGSKGGDVCLVKTDSDGNLIWSKTFGGADRYAGLSVQLTSDGGYIIGGITVSFGAIESDVYLVKTDPEGNMLWNKTFGGSGDDLCESAQQTSDGGYIIAGRTMSFGAGGLDVYLVKTDPEGNMLWNKTFGGSENDLGSCVQQTTDGGYIIAGVTESFGWGRYEVYLIKVADVRATSTISCSVSPKSVTQGESITVTGSIHPSVSGVTVTLTYSKLDGSPFTRTVKTDAEGVYSDSYTPTEIGSWNVQVSWGGDVEREGASSQQIAFTVEEKEVPKEEKKSCIIATATYGSELSPEVQFLRGFRDNIVLNTFAGGSFMTVFNAWYYSFSPRVASAIGVNNALRDLMKILLYPLIGILHLVATTNSLFGFNQEFAVITSGLIASSLIGFIYIGPLALIIHISKKVKEHPITLRVGMMIWVISVGGIVAAEITRWSSIMMFSTAIFVLTTMGLAPLFSVKYIAKHIKINYKM